MQYDLTRAMIPFLDRHMVFHLGLLEHLGDQKFFPPQDLQLAKLQLVMKTSMVELAIDEFKALLPASPVPTQLTARREAIVSSHSEFKTACTPLLDGILGEGHENSIDSTDDSVLIDTAKARLHVASSSTSQADISRLHGYAKLLFDIGYYKRALIYLFIFRSLNKEDDTNFQGLWGLLAAEILVAYDQHNQVPNLKRSFDVLNVLRDAVDQRQTDHELQLQQRTWLIHWSLFLFFNPKCQSTDSTCGGLLDFLFRESLNQDKFLNAIQTSCPHIFRYVSVAVVCSVRSRRTLLDELVSVLVEESYRDPITSFLVSLYHDFDMEAAHNHLKDAASLFASDYFLSLSSSSSSRLVDEFMENARDLLFEIYCKTHERIDLSLLATRLHVSEDQIGPRIVRFIRERGLHGKIDSASNQLVLERERPSVYQTVINKTKGLTYRTSQMLSILEKPAYRE
jgi:translation initiation factor 3 subunit E